MVKECCQNEVNLVAETSGREDVTLKRCRVCNCRHFSVGLELGDFKVQLEQKGRS